MLIGESGSASATMPVDSTSEVPPEDSDRADPEVTESISSITSKAAQDGPPGQQKRDARDADPTDRSSNRSSERRGGDSEPSELEVSVTADSGVDATAVQTVESANDGDVESTGSDEQMTDTNMDTETETETETRAETGTETKAEAEVDEEEPDELEETVTPRTGAERAMEGSRLAVEQAAQGVKRVLDSAVNGTAVTDDTGDGEDSGETPQTGAERAMEGSRRAVEQAAAGVGKLLGDALRGGSRSEDDPGDDMSAESEAEPTDQVEARERSTMSNAERIMQPHMEAMERSGQTLRDMVLNAVMRRPLSSMDGIGRIFGFSQATTNPSEGFVSPGGDVTVDIKPSTSGYNNTIFWSTDNFKTLHEIGVDNSGKSVNLGVIPKGTVIQFAINNGQGDLFVQGKGDANSDKLQHAQVKRHDDGSMTIGFEDLKGGGDNDFDDAVIKVRAGSGT